MSAPQPPIRVFTTHARVCASPRVRVRALSGHDARRMDTTISIRVNVGPVVAARRARCRAMPVPWMAQSERSFGRIPAAPRRPDRDRPRGRASCRAHVVVYMGGTAGCTRDGACGGGVHTYQKKSLYSSILQSLCGDDTCRGRDRGASGVYKNSLHRAASSWVGWVNTRRMRWCARDHHHHAPGVSDSACAVFARRRRRRRGW